MTYCIDTSSLIAAWQERYPIENFPAFWVKVEALIEDGRLIAPVAVLHEIKKRSDELHIWLKARRGMFRELDDAVQIEAAQILAQFPRLSVSGRCAPRPDPFVIALARVRVLEPVHDLLRRSTRNARWTICKLVFSFRSQFFQSLRHFSSHAKDLSTTHRFGMTAKV